MNKIINFLLYLCNKLNIYLFKKQEKLFCKNIIKICEKISKLYNIKMDVYSEINYFEGRDATIYFEVNNKNEIELLNEYLFKSSNEFFKSYNFEFFVTDTFYKGDGCKIIWSNKN